jgi:hypothetical protein
MNDKPEIDGLREFRWPFRNHRDLVAELFCACRWQIGPEEAADFAASYLFDELRLRVGKDEAEKVFLRTIKERRNISEDHEIRMLLFRLNMMRDKRTGKRQENVQALAKLIVAEHEAFNKSPKRNGQPARQTNQPSIEKWIRRIRDEHGAAWRADMGLPPQSQKKKKPAGKIAKRQSASAPKPRISQR